MIQNSAAQKNEKDNWSPEEVSCAPDLHEIFFNNVRLERNPVEGDEARRRSILDPGAQTGIHLSIRKFAQASTYKFFPYGAAEPRMIDYALCAVCAASMLPVSCLTNREGEKFLTLGLCPQCGFFQHSKRPPKDWYAHFYRKVWDPKGHQESDWPKDVPPRLEVLKNVYGYALPGQRVLEIGSGWGACLLAFKQAGFKPVGVEATAHRSEFIRKGLGIPCFTGEAETLPIGQGELKPGSFDLIFSTNVLEHVYNTREVLEHVHALLRPNGLGYFEVPIYTQENLTLNTHGVSHTCNFSHANFLYLLQSIGYDIVKDLSDPVMVRFLLRKCPPLTEEQKQTKLQWMSGFLPHRGLSTILDKNGLGRLPVHVEQDQALKLEWFLDVNGENKNRFLMLEFDFLSQFSQPLNTLRGAITRRKPLELIAHLLPIQYVYPSNEVPIWYY